MGYSSERRVSTSSESRLIGGIAGWNPGQNAAREQERAAQAELDAAASREESARQMAYIRALGNPRLPTVELPEIKSCALPDDFEQQIAQLDAQIYERGVAIDRERLLSLGRERFQQLLTADREARYLGRVIGSKTDLSQFREVFMTFANLGVLREIPVPERTMGEQVNGTGKEKDAARKVESFFDLWKLSASEPGAIRDVYAFRDVFEPLVFAQSMLEHLDQNSRAHSQFFCGGNDKRVDYFTDWFSVLKGKHLRVTLTNALQSIVFFLTDEANEPIEAVVLSREFLGVRSPNEQQIALAQAVFDAFLLDYRDWDLWNYVGSKTRKISREDWLETWRVHLAKQFPAISNFHEQIRAAFWRNAGGGQMAGYRAFESSTHRTFINEIVQHLLHCASALLALAIEETTPSSLVARFQDRALCEVKESKQKTLRDNISDKLAAAFAGSMFNVQIEEVKA